MLIKNVFLILHRCVTVPCNEKVLLKRGNYFMIKNVTIKENKYYFDVEMLLNE